MAIILRLALKLLGWRKNTRRRHGHSKAGALRANTANGRTLKPSYPNPSEIRPWLPIVKRTGMSLDVLKKTGIAHFPRARVRCVVDGDTVILAREWGDFKVRLDGIDCPEDGQAWGLPAKIGLRNMIEGRYVYYEEHGFDVYGRLVATLYLLDDDADVWTNVNERMVMLGHAWVTPDFLKHLPEDRQRALAGLESWARKKRMGLWSNPDPIPPWEWRCANPEA